MIDELSIWHLVSSSELQAMDFHVELDAFTRNVPIFDNVTFTNIVAKLNPDAKEYLTLACHYDSKYFPNEVFQGAVDSAVPCAIMLNVAKTLQTQLNPWRTKDDLSLMVYSIYCSALLGTRPFH